MKKTNVSLPSSTFYYVPDTGNLFVEELGKEPVYLFDRDDLSWLSSVGEIVDFLAPDDVGGFDEVKAIMISGDIMDSFMLLAETIEVEGVDIYR